MKYQVASPDLGKKELAYVTQSLKDGWISWRGPWVERLHREFAERHNAKYAVSCTSGTTALTLALAALGIHEGDEVIVPEFTMVATAWAVTYNNATPVFVDCDENFLIDVSKIEEKITSKTRAIMPVHVFGRQVDMKKIKEVADKHNLKIVEDAALAHSFEAQGDVTCYSFFANKIITAGEGGICVTNNRELADRMFYLRNMAFDPKHTFLHNELGYNFRMTSLQAALALAQLERLDEFLAKRKQIEGWYNEGLKDIPEITIHPPRKILWMYDLSAERKDELMEFLEKNEIETRHLFKPMSMQPMYCKNEDYKNTRAYQASLKGFYLPTYTKLTKRDVKNICEKIKEFYARS